MTRDAVVRNLGDGVGHHQQLEAVGISHPLAITFILSSINPHNSPILSREEYFDHNLAIGVVAAQYLNIYLES